MWRSECNRCMGRGFFEEYLVPLMSIDEPFDNPAIAVNATLEIVKTPCTCIPNNQRRIRFSRPEYEERKAIEFDIETLEYRQRENRS